MSRRPVDNEEGFTEDLLLRVSQGDREAWSELFGRLGGTLYRLFGGKIPTEFHSRFDTGDLVQEGMVKVAGNAGKFKARGAGSARRWIVRVIKNLLRDKKRHHFAMKRDLRCEVYLGLMSDAEPNKALENATMDVACLEKVEELADDERHVILKCVIEGRTANSVADEMDLSVEEVRKLRARGIESLSRLIPGVGSIRG